MRLYFPGAGHWTSTNEAWECISSWKAHCTSWWSTKSTGLRIKQPEVKGTPLPLTSSMTLGKLREPLCPSVQQLTLGSPVAPSEGQGRFTGPHSQGSIPWWPILGWQHIFLCWWVLHIFKLHYILISGSAGLSFQVWVGIPNGIQLKPNGWGHPSALLCIIPWLYSLHHK